MQHLSLTKTPIGGGLLLFHANGTIIDAVSIGRNCRIVSNVTIGYKNGQKVTIKDNVEILANAVIIGGITIGNNCIIGPGAVVFKSIPDNCVVVGNPAFILKENGVLVNRKL
jgi:serine O-acetyltransferase